MGINYFEQFSQMDEIKDKVVVVLGITGVGKSSFILNHLFYFYKNFILAY